MADLLPALVVVGVGVLVLVVVLVALSRHVRRFTRERAEVDAQVRSARAQLRAIASVRGKHHPHGVDSP